MIDWSQWSEIAQVIAIPVTSMGVLVSLWIGVSTLRELRNERTIRARPLLLFDSGARVCAAVFDDLGGVPGIVGPEVDANAKRRPPGPNRIGLKEDWGEVKNHGTGVAINTRITIIPYRLFIGGESFLVDDAKRTTFPYEADANRIPARPSHIPPGASGSFRRLPTPIVCDYERKIERMDCVVAISFSDAFKNKFCTYQGVRVWVGTDVRPGQWTVTFTFIETIDPEKPDFSIFGEPANPPILLSAGS